MRKKYIEIKRDEEGKGEGEEYRKAGRTQIIQEKYFWQAAHFFLALERTTLKWIRNRKKARKKREKNEKKGSFRIKDLLAKCTRGASSRAQLPLAPMP